MIRTTIFALVYVALCATICYSASVTGRQKIADASNTAGPTGSDCHIRTPCAWGVYIPFSREFHYYLKNTCNCPNGTVCMKKDDDISVSAYVYRCDKIESNASSLYNGSYSEFATILPDDVTR